MFWSCQSWAGKRSSRSYDGSLVIPAGTAVTVIEIGGAMALVYPWE